VAGLETKDGGSGTGGSVGLPPAGSRGRAMVASGGKAARS